MGFPLIELEKEVNELLDKLRSMIAEYQEKMKESRIPNVGIISKEDFMMMLGRPTKDGGRKPISHPTFKKIVKDAGGRIKVEKLGKLTYITDWPGRDTSKPVQWGTGEVYTGDGKKKGPPSKRRVAAEVAA